MSFFVFLSDFGGLLLRSEGDKNFHGKKENEWMCEPIDEDHDWRPSTFLPINSLKTIVSVASLTMRWDICVYSREFVNLVLCSS